MVAAVRSRQFVFDLLVHGKVEGVSGPRPVQDDVDTPHRVRVTLVAHDAIQGVDHAPVVGVRVGHETLHPRL